MVAQILYVVTGITRHHSFFQLASIRHTLDMASDDDGFVYAPDIYEGFVRVRCYTMC